MHELVLARATRQHAGSFLLGPSTSTSSIRPTRASCLASALRSTTTRSRSKRSAATAGSTKRSVIVGRLGARPRREDERVRVVVLGRRGDLERAREVVVGLAGEADDDVGRHGEVGDAARAVGEALEVALGGVAAVHRRQDPVAARTAAGSAGARTPPASSAIAANVSARMSFGCGLVKRTRRMPVDGADGARAARRTAAAAGRRRRRPGGRRAAGRGRSC